MAVSAILLIYWRNTMKPQDKHAIENMRLDGITPAEIASRLHLSPNTVYSHKITKHRIDTRYQFGVSDLAKNPYYNTMPNPLKSGSFLAKQGGMKLFYGGCIFRKGGAFLFKRGRSIISKSFRKSVIFQKCNQSNEKYKMDGISLLENH